MYFSHILFEPLYLSTDLLVSGSSRASEGHDMNSQAQGNSYDAIKQDLRGIVHGVVQLDLLKQLTCILQFLQNAK